MRPYTLPMDNDRFVFRRDEWEQDLPGRDHERFSSTRVQTACAFGRGESGEYYYFPDRGSGCR